jgi:hypothetical protein
VTTDPAPLAAQPPQQEDTLVTTSTPVPRPAIHLGRIRPSYAARAIRLLRQRAGRLRVALFVLVLLSALLTTTLCARTRRRATRTGGSRPAVDGPRTSRFVTLVGS